MKSSVLFFLLASAIYANAQQTDDKAENTTTPSAISLAKSDFPLEGFTIRTSSGSKMEPLFVVDGVSKTRDELKDIKSNDIQAISVLKDSSTIIYGEKGRYGVILISLKDKSKDRPKD